MRTYELERADFDRWLKWVLTVSNDDARPPEQMWQRIVRHIVNSDWEVHKMLFNHYEAEQIMKMHVRDALCEAEQRRLIAAVHGHRNSREWWQPVVLIFRSLLAILTDRRVDEPECQCPSTAYCA